MTYIFKGHIKTVKTYMVKLNIKISDKPKIMKFPLIKGKYI